MAKKKEKIEEDNDESSSSNVLSIIKKQFGDIYRPASEILEQKLEVFSTGSPMLDIALGGGVQEGSFVEMAGLEKIGKTTTLIQMATNFMKKDRPCYYIDAENRFDKKNLEIHDLDASKLTLIRSEKCKILDANDTLALMEQIIKNEDGAFIILDSASSLLSRERSLEDAKADRRDSRPKLWADWIPGISPLLRINRCTLAVVRHFGANTSGTGPKWVADAGKKIDFRKDVSLHCTWWEKWLDNDKKWIGNVLHWNILATNFKAPVKQVDSYIRFGYGVDSIIEIVKLGVETGLIEKAGSWLTVELGETIRLQGEEKMVSRLKENPEQFELLQNKLKEMLV